MKKILLVIPLVLLFAHLMMANDGPNLWTVTTTSVGRVLALAVNPTNQQIMYCGSLDSGIMKSTNGGANWFAARTGMTYFHVQSMAIAPSNPNIIYAGTDSLGGYAICGVYKSTDAGATWTLTSNSTIEQRSIQGIAVSSTDPNKVVIGVFNAQGNSTHGIYKTTNGGTTWTVSNTGITSPNKNFLCITQNPLNPNVLYAGTSLEYNGTLTQGPPHIYKSVTGGDSWFEVSSGLPTATTENNPIRDIAISRADTAVGIAIMFNNTTNGGAYITTNGGGAWVRKVTGLITVAGNLPRGVIFRPGSSTEIFLAVENATTGGVFRTTNRGDVWVNFNGGAILPSYPTRTFAYRSTPDSTLFVGVGSTSVTTPPGMGIYEYTQYVPVGISNNNNGIPKEFALHQNFPNPFNPSTNIQYDIPKASNVNITIYDASGRVVKELVNEFRTAGRYSEIFNASSISSGIYFYKITAGDYTNTKKMILIK